MPVQDSAVRDDDLHLLLLEQHKFETGPETWLRAGIASLVAHLLIVPGLVWLVFFAPPPARLASNRSFVDVRRAIHLTAPVLPKPKIAEPTQTAPNHGKPAREVTAENLQAKTPPKPFQPPSTPRPASPPPGPLAVPEPPKIEAPKVAQQPPPALGATPTAPPPPIPQATQQASQQSKGTEKPKIAFETPGSQSGASQGQQTARLQPPKSTVDEAIRSATRPGGGGIMVGDAGSESSNPFAPPAQRGTASSLELLSDPQGVDFRPYLTQILATVRRNWLAVVPESARLEGRKGRVLIQFTVDRSGKVPKLVIAMPSGSEALDRAAVAGISASNPFPPLPAGFKGDLVKLQFAFSYNMNR